MAAASATLFINVYCCHIGRPHRRSSMNVSYITGLNSFGGLKAHNNVASLGLPVCTEQSFAEIVSSLRILGKGQGRSGSVLSSTCNAACWSCSGVCSSPN